MAVLRKNRRFVRLFAGRLITNAGDSLYFIGGMWLVYELTGSSFYTGLAGFLIQAPSALQFLVGPLVDRWRLRSVLVGTQIINGSCVLIVPFAAVTGHLSIWVVLLVMPVLSFVNQFVYPAQNAALPQLVEESNLVRANSLFSTAYQGSEVAFNAAGGVILAAVGATTLFVIDSVTFAVAATLFFGVAIPAADATDSEDAADEDESYLTELREGIVYLRGSLVAPMLFGLMLANFGSGAILAVLPAFADTIGGPETYGLLMAALTGGPLLGAAGASLVEEYPWGLVSIVGFVSIGFFLFVALLVSGLLSTAVLFLVTFVPVGTFNVMYSSMLQSAVDESLLGRVSSVTSSASMLMLPAGNLIGGVAANSSTPTTVMFAVAGLFTLVGFYFLVKPKLRSFPPVSEADEAALELHTPSDV